MLDTNTKRRIDKARSIIWGKVPDPKSHIEQITIALIYKFMDDMDAEVEELGGDRTFFADSFAKFGWSMLMSPTVGGHELLKLYSEGISTMPQNAGIPALFRDIFKNAYLPYRDPETLKSFLKVIDEFKYDHSERLGDAFEYLLSILPPIEIQKAIVEEIEAEQTLVNANRELITRFEKKIKNTLNRVRV